MTLTHPHAHKHTHHDRERWVEGEETVSGKVELFTVWVYKTADEGGAVSLQRGSSEEKRQTRIGRVTERIESV